MGHDLVTGCRVGGALATVAMAMAMAWDMGCGEAEEPHRAGHRGPAAGPCEPRTTSGPVSMVDLLVASPMPAELSSSCPEGDPSELEALLTVVNASKKMESADASGVRGCFPNVATGQSFHAILFFRVATSLVALTEQQTFVELPDTSDAVVELSFAGAPVSDYGSNRTKWCAGTL